MTPSVEIEVFSANEGQELVQCLWLHGLSAGLTRVGGQLQVEVRSPPEDPPRFFLNLYDALEGWRPGCGSWLTFADPHSLETSS